jgi:hypothetical protein
MHQQHKSEYGAYNLILRPSGLLEVKLKSNGNRAHHFFKPFLIGNMSK